MSSDISRVITNSRHTCFSLVLIASDESVFYKIVPSITRDAASVLIDATLLTTPAEPAKKFQPLTLTRQSRHHLRPLGSTPAVEWLEPVSTVAPTTQVYSVQLVLSVLAPGNFLHVCISI